MTETDTCACDEALLLERWIRDQLRRAGYSERDAAVAIAEGLDWRSLVRLRERGCPDELALAIVR